MLPQPTLITPIPELTVSVAQAAFPKGNTFMLMRDEALLPLFHHSKQKKIRDSRIQ